MGKSRKTCVVGVAAIAAVSMAASTEAAVLLGKWGLQEGSGTTANDTGGTTVQNLALGGSAAFATGNGPTSLLTNSLNLTGYNTTGNPADHALSAAFGGDSQFNAASMRDGYTITGWIQDTGATYSGNERFISIAGQISGGFNNYIAFIGLLDDNQLSIRVRDVGTNAISWTTVNTAPAKTLADPAAPKWVFVAFTIDDVTTPGSMTMQAYAGPGGSTAGTLLSLGQNVVAGTLMDSNPAYVSLGASLSSTLAWASGTDFRGYGADFRVYSGSMTQAEVLGVYTASFVPEPTLLGLAAPAMLMFGRRRRRL